MFSFKLCEKVSVPGGRMLYGGGLVEMEVGLCGEDMEECTC